MATNLKKTIMRRVYYAYALNIMTSSALWQGFLLGACVALFGRLTHVAAIYRNLSATSLENTPTFIWNSFANALTHGEVLTVLVVLFMLGLTAKFFHSAARAAGLIRHVQVA